MSSIPATPTQSDAGLRHLYWLSLALFVAYLCIAIALPVMSVFVTTQLGYSNGLAGLAVGIAFASTILTRGMAGRIADGRGSRYCMLRGLWVYTAAGLLCGVAGWPGFPASIAYLVLLAGRLLLGLGESLAVVGAIAWCCQRRLNSPQKRRSKIPQFRRSDARAWVAILWWSSASW